MDKRRVDPEKVSTCCDGYGEKVNTCYHGCGEMVTVMVQKRGGDGVVLCLEKYIQGIVNINSPFIIWVVIICLMYCVHRQQVFATELLTNISILMLTNMFA